LAGAQVLVLPAVPMLPPTATPLHGLDAHCIAAPIPPKVLTGTPVAAATVTLAAPTMLIEVPVPPEACHFAWETAMAERNPPAMPLTAATRASCVTLMKRGKAVAANIPKITMTTISSTNVNPFARAFMEPLLDKGREL
jgi:hypothetical protein